MILIKISLILVLCGSSLASPGEIEDCLEYSIMKENQKVHLNDSVLMDIYPNQPLANSTLTGKEEANASSSTLPVITNTSSQEQDAASWEVTAFIEDSRGSWCNMTISEHSIKVFCSSGASGNHSSDSVPLFAMGHWKKILLHFNPQLTNTGRSNGKNTTQFGKSGTAKMSSSPSYGIGLQGHNDYLIVIEDANITRPLTLRWATVQSGLKVIYNCWDGCIRSTRLNKIRGNRPFYLLKKKGFNGINITFSVLGNRTRYHVLTPDDFGSFGMRRWIPISLRRESTSLKVFIGYEEIMEITNMTSTIVTAMEVSLMGEGSVTWCDLTSTSSNGLLIAVWTFAFGCLLLAIYSIATTVKSYKSLKEWKTNKDMGIKVNVLPPLEFESNEKLRTPSPSGELEWRRTSHASVNSAYDSASLVLDITRTKANVKRVDSPHGTLGLSPSVDLATGEGRTSCIVIPEAQPDEDNSDLISTCSTDLPIAISCENNFDLDSVSSIELPRAVRARGNERNSSSSSETASSAMINDAYSSAPSSLNNRPKVTDGFAVNVRKRLSQLAMFPSMQITNSENELLGEPNK